MERSRPSPGGAQPPTRSWGAWTFADLEQQPSPRVFTTHLQHQALPASIHAAGRLVVVTRNPKDALCSLAKFWEKLASMPAGTISAAASRVAKSIVGEAEGGLGALADAFNTKQPADRTGTFGDYYTYYSGMCGLADSLGQDRAIVLSYEALRGDFRREVERLAAFLGVGPLSEAKFEAVARRTSMDTMRSAGIVTVNKGVVGGHAGVLPARVSEEIDLCFDTWLAGVPAMRPLQAHMFPGPAA